ncbi:predicted protein [Streptomyces albidoflavus]|uniref:Uncharacterized protein n=1 Tax=Streptomyces albidoflavus TaxID=1886 RepID=A0AA37BY07_9ACTN|nr:predicted protein [Streptomyces albidoflavus]BDH51715.1 hypothetical protein MTP02_27260 [Streptomyces albus]GHI46812.1 hypothetical protein ScoT_29860 [Streptomyces albidoflavus]
MASHLVIRRRAASHTLKREGLQVGADLDIGPAAFVLDLYVALLDLRRQPEQPDDLGEVGGRVLAMGRRHFWLVQASLGRKAQELGGKGAFVEVGQAPICARLVSSEAALAAAQCPR